MGEEKSENENKQTNTVFIDSTAPTNARSIPTDNKNDTAYA
jgi:hypothetical protein